ncbi:hypothetical protein L9F63_023222, partial [Diploptera punctata]
RRILCVRDGVTNEDYRDYIVIHNTKKSAWGSLTGSETELRARGSGTGLGHGAWARSSCKIFEHGAKALGSGTGLGKETRASFLERGSGLGLRQGSVLELNQFKLDSIINEIASFSSVHLLELLRQLDLLNRDTSTFNKNILFDNSDIHLIFHGELLVQYVRKRIPILNANTRTRTG